MVFKQEQKTKTTEGGTSAKYFQAAPVSPRTDGVLNKAVGPAGLRVVGGVGAHSTNDSAAAGTAEKKSEGRGHQDERVCERPL